jgi:hypothetical protein
MYAEMFAGLLWAGASLAVMMAGFMLAAGAADLDFPLAAAGVTGALALAGTGFVSAGYSLGWLIRVASG